MTERPGPVGPSTTARTVLRPLPFGDAPITAPTPLGGITVVNAPGRAAAGGAPVTLRAIPYFTWANRDIGAMRVWIPHA